MLDISGYSDGEAWGVSELRAPLSSFPSRVQQSDRWSIHWQQRHTKLQPHYTQGVCVCVSTLHLAVACQVTWTKLKLETSKLIRPRSQWRIMGVLWLSMLSGTATSWTSCVKLQRWRGMNLKTQSWKRQRFPFNISKCKNETNVFLILDDTTFSLFFKCCF